MKIEKLIKWVSLVLSICGLLLIFFPIQGMLILTMVLPFYVLFLDVLFNEMYGNITIAFEALQ